MKTLRELLNELDTDTLISYRTKRWETRKDPHRGSDFMRGAAKKQRQDASWDLAGAKIHGPRATDYPKDDVIRSKSPGQRGQKTQGQKDHEKWHQDTFGWMDKLKKEKPKLSRADKVRNLYNNPGTSGEKNAAGAAMKRMGIRESIMKHLLNKLENSQTEGEFH